MGFSIENTVSKNGPRGFQFCSIASGSSGNCYLVRTNEAAILVDAGISGKRIIEGILATGMDPWEIDALVLTHEHIDHVKSVRVLCSKIPGLEIFCTQGTWDNAKNMPENPRLNIIEAGDSFSVGDIDVETFPLSHDAAEPCGYSFVAEGRRVTVLTDSGYVTDRAHRKLGRSDLLVLESNHDVETLKFCSYPYVTKRRILSDEGHLSNEAAGKEILRILKERLRGEFEEGGPLDEQGDFGDDANVEFPEPPVVLLAHLSKETNFPQMALQTICNIIEEEEFHDGVDVFLSVLSRDNPSEIFEV